MLADRLDAFENAAVEHSRDSCCLPARVRTLRRQAVPDEGLKPHCGAVKGVAFRHTRGACQSRAAETRASTGTRGTALGIARGFGLLDTRARRIQAGFPLVRSVHRPYDGFVPNLAAVLAEHRRELAEYELRVVETIHPQDEMFSGNPFAYLNVGRSAIACITIPMILTGKTSVEAILDLPCGHGRVCRWLRARFPDARIVACDLLRDGVDFCAEQFGAIPVYSKVRPREIPIEERFDLIWVGSLLTHLDAPLWDEFLEFFIDRLMPNGLLVFTTHGRWPALRDGSNPKVREPYLKRGFGYVPMPEQEFYGTSASSPAWVTDALVWYDTIRIVSYVERCWNDHQDMVALVKNPVLGEFAGPALV
jgi:SAM-dependent methyltransferase